MAVVRPFKGIRPNEGLEQQIASLPYDVMNRAEAKKMAEGNEKSFLHVVRAEIDFDDSVNAYDESIYKASRARLDSMIDTGDLVQENQPVYYIYRQIMNGRVQTGLVACTSVDEYLDNVIKKHEFTREAKEIDRINNFDHCDANTAPIFLTYRKNDRINEIVNDWIKFNMPIYNFVTEDDITHIVWILNKQELVSEIEGIFEGIGNLYIADGHHRSASSAKVGLKRRKENPDYTGEEEFNFFMSVIFPDEDLFIMDYNRVVKDLNGFSVDELIGKISEKFDVEKKTEVGTPYHPDKKHQFAMLLDGHWYAITAKEGSFDKNDPVNSLDAAILQNNLLNPLLDIDDPRTNNRIDFVGGIRGLEALESRVNNDMEIAFALYPVTIDDLMEVADSGLVMPPKSTWFEPKLRSGLFVHRLK
jgi:uncharacterized protein (DUF1015 family)